MKLTALRLFNVRRFAARGIAIENIGEGVNVLSAVNEFGKSTCFDALHALFFQPHTSTASGLKALRPYSGGAPVIEADIETAEGAYRLTKQFMGGRRASVREISTGRLIAQADEAEAFIAALVQGGTAGPAGLLWVRQGVTGLESRSKADEVGEKRARESVLTSVQGEVEQLTGGRRMAQALARCEEELSQLVTDTGRPRVGGPYKAALEERERLAAEEQRLAGEVKTLRDALDKRRLLRDRQRELEEPEAANARQRDVEQAQAALDAANAQGAALATAQAQTDLARTHFENANLALETWHQQRRTLARLTARLEEIDTQRAAVQARSGEAYGLVEASTLAVDESEREERDTSALLARVDSALKARAAREQLVILNAHARTAEDARASIEAIGARLKAQAISPEQLKPLEELDSRIIGLRATLDAQSPSLAVRYLAGAAQRLELDGAALEGGVNHPLLHNATILLPGVAELMIAVPAGSSAQAALEAAEARQTAALKALGVASLAEAKARETATHALQKELALAKQSLALHAPNGLAALREEIARLNAQAEAVAGNDAPELKADPQALRGRLEAVRGAIVAARAQASEARVRLERARGAAFTVEQEAATLTAQIAALNDQLGPPDQRAAREAALGERARETSETLKTLEASLSAQRARDMDVAGAQARLRRLRSVQDAAKAEIGRLREDIAGLSGEIQARAEEAIEEAWQESRDALTQAVARLATFEREVGVLMRLRKALEAARVAAREHYFAPVMAELRPLLQLLFEDASVTFNEETLLPRTVMRDGLEEPVDGLSGGMREQLAILTRLAFARLLAREGAPAPVILDDALVYSDDDRIERMFDALHRQASDQQIIVFSCRQRAFAQLGGHVLHTVPWEPAP